jgi:hypothetical protein
VPQSPRTGRKRRQQINLCEKFDESPGRTGLAFIERQSPLHRERPRQIRVTAVMVFRPLQQQVGVGIASCTDDVVHPSAIFVPSIPVERIVGNVGHWMQSWERAPKPVTSA